MPRQPGVILAALISDDGVPVAVPGTKVDSAESERCVLSDSDALAAMCAGWLDELNDSMALLSCDGPRRVVLRAARGSLLLLRTSGAVLLVVLEPGLGPDRFILLGLRPGLPEYYRWPAENESRPTTRPHP